MPAANKMTCPECGAEMNQHAQKIVYGSDDSAIVDPDFGGVVNEVHCCPKCGRIELRAV